MLSWVGDGVANVALIIRLQTTEGTGAAVGLLLLVTMLPSVFAPITGVVVDRFDRRRVLVGGELAQAVVAAVIVVTLPGLAPLLILVFVKSIAASICDIAGRSAIATVVDHNDLVAANAWFGGGRQAADVIGPVLGGVFVAVASVRFALAVDLATFLLGVPLLLRLPALAPAAVERVSGWLADARDGLAYIATNAVARALLISFFLLGLGAADDVALPFLARELGAGDVGIGVLYGSVALGLVVAFVVMGRGRFRTTPLRGFVVGCVIVAVGEVFTGLAGVIAIAVAFQFVRGIGAAAIDVNLQTGLQRSVPPDMLGRVFANVYGAVGVSAAISTGIAGPLVDATSPGTVLVATGVVALLAGLVARALTPTAEPRPS